MRVCGECPGLNLLCAAHCASGRPRDSFRQLCFAAGAELAVGRGGRSERPSAGTGRGAFLLGRLLPHAPALTPAWPPPTAALLRHECCEDGDAWGSVLGGLGQDRAGSRGHPGSCCKRSAAQAPAQGAVRGAEHAALVPCGPGRPSGSPAAPQHRDLLRPLSSHVLMLSRLKPA